MMAEVPATDRMLIHEGVPAGSRKAHYVPTFLFINPFQTRGDSGAPAILLQRQVREVPGNAQVRSVTPRLRD